MSANTYRVIEIVGTSTDGSDAAIANGVERAGQTMDNLDWFEVLQLRGHIDNGSIQHYQATLKVGFRLNEPG